MCAPQRCSSKRSTSTVPAPDTEVCTMCSTPAARAASTRFRPCRTSESPVGSARSGTCTENTPRAPASAALSDATSSRSPRTRTAPREPSAAARSEPGSRTRACTGTPPRRSARATAPPCLPVAPVTMTNSDTAILHRSMWGATPFWLAQHMGWPSVLSNWEDCLMTNPKTAPQRSDWQRNHERLLAAAAALVARDGAQVSLEEIARDAGVGSATLHRHFPSRQALLEEVFRDTVERLRRRARELAAGDPRTGLVTWLEELTI